MFMYYEYVPMRMLLIDRNINMYNYADHTPQSCCGCMLDDIALYPDPFMDGGVNTEDDPRPHMLAAKRKKFLSKLQM